MSATEIAKALSCGEPGCNCGKEINPGTWETHCPLKHNHDHNDRTPSFHVTQDGDKILVHCKGGCSQEDVIEALKGKDLWQSRNGDWQAQEGGGLTLREFAQAKHFDPSFLSKHGVNEATGKDSKPYLIFRHKDIEGKPLASAERYRKSMTERPYGKKKAKGGEPAIYGLWRLNGFRPKGEIIFCEGESDCLTFWMYDLPVIALPGKTMFKTIDPALFAGFETVYVWQEPKAEDFPTGIAARLKDVPGLTVKALIPPDGIKDISEAHCQGLDTLALLDRLKADAKAVEPAPGKQIAQKKNPEPLNMGDISFEGLAPLEARQLIRDLKLTASQVLCVLAQKPFVFHDSLNDAYASVEGITYSVSSSDFKLWLKGKYYEIAAKGPNDQAVKDAIGVIESHAIFKGPELPVFVRLAKHGGKIYLDLADGGRAVEITQDGWRIINNSPVKFLRRRGMIPLPAPQDGGDISPLAGFLNLPDDGGQSFRLIVSWLVAALRPSGPYPILALTGPQGSAKSTAARILRLLIDPSSAPLKAEPKELEHLMLSARNGWVICLDNLTKLPSWLSDGLCRLATGGGFATRKLYTNDDEFIFEAMRPIILTAINSVASAHDLADRQIVIDLPAIDDCERQGEKRLWERFETARPRLLGALLNGVAMALKKIDSISLERLPRMADFALWATAAETAWGWEPGSFMAAYNLNRADMVKMSIEGDPVALAVVELMKDREIWEGRPTDLLAALNGHISDTIKRSKFWPQAVNSLTRRLKRAEVFLKAAGISYEHGENNVGSWTLLRRINTATIATNATLQENHHFTGGDTTTVSGDSAKILPLPNRLKSISSGESGDCGDIFTPLRDRQEVVI